MSQTKTEPSKELMDSARSCQNIEFVLAARGREEDTPKDDDFARAGEGCVRLKDALRKSGSLDSPRVLTELATLRVILAELGMPPASPAEQLAAAERKAAKLKGLELFYELPELSKRALEVGEVEKASDYAKLLLEMAPKFPKDWNYGNAVFHGNLILGRIALRKGEIPKAEEYLLAAGATTGSPQLDSFGPSMTLAKELIEHKRTESVLKFFVLCNKFWEMDDGKLERWSAEVRRGEVPDFGSNLRY